MGRSGWESHASAPHVCFLGEMVLIVSGVFQSCGAYWTGRLFVIILGVIWSFRAGVRVIGKRGISGCNISRWASPVSGLGEAWLSEGVMAME